MNALAPSLVQGLVALLFAAGLVTATTAYVLFRRLRRDIRQASELKFEPPAKPAPEPEPKDAAAEEEEDEEDDEDDEDAAKEELERLRQEKERIDAEKRREEYWKDAEQSFVRFTKSLSQNEAEPLIYTFIPFGLGMGIAALFESRLFVIQSGSKRLGISFDKVRRFKFVFVSSGRYDLHVFVSSIETPRLVVAHLDIASMDRWNEIYLRIKEGRL